MIDRFRLGTLNLFNFLEPPGAFYEQENVYSPLEWERKQAWTADILYRMGCDVVGLQEVFSPEPLASWCGSVGLAHFATVDAPKGDYVWDKPVVALASRFPIESAEPVPIEPPAGCPLPAEFEFSRVPIRAVIRVPGFGPLRIYVVHLKSSRPIWQQEDCPPSSCKPGGEVSQQDQHELAMQTLVMQPHIGGWAAMAQRGWEASLVMADICRMQSQTPMATVVMGDFNDELTSGALVPLLRLSRSPWRGPLRGTLTDEQALAFNHRYALRDARDLALYQTNRAATYYWGPKPLQLDHILLSADFDPDFGQSLCQVDKVELLDRHLVQNDPRSDLQCSDHGALVVQVSVRV